MRCLPYYLLFELHWICIFLAFPNMLYSYCCAEQLLMFNQNVFDISSVHKSTYTHKSVNRLNVYGRDVTDQNKPGGVDIYARISVCALWWQCSYAVYCEFVCFKGIWKYIF